MGYEFVGVGEGYSPNKTVKRLGNFILTKPEFLMLFKQICEVVNPNEKDMNVSSTLVQSVLAQGKEVFSQQEVDKFAELVDGFVTEDIRDSGNTRGKLFEYLIYKNGPFSFQATSNLKIIRQCKVIRCDGSPVGGSSNMDLCFLVRGRSEDLILNLELLECKLNLNTFLGDSYRCKSKLKYMKALSVAGISPHYSVGFVTLSHDTEKLRVRLDALGHETLVLFGYKEVKTLMLNMDQS